MKEQLLKYVEYNCFSEKRMELLILLQKTKFQHSPPTFVKEGQSAHKPPIPQALGVKKRVYTIKYYVYIEIGIMLYGDKCVSS